MAKTDSQAKIGSIGSSVSDVNFEKQPQKIQMAGSSIQGGVV